jgi:hypothetical protein
MPLRTDIVRNSSGAVAEVKFKGGSFIADWDQTMHNKVLYFWNGVFKVEVIGNIYEHGHLLK